MGRRCMGTYRCGTAGYAPTALQNDFLRRLSPAALAAAGAPERLFFFGTPAMSPSLINLYAALAEYIDVHLFLPNPCREYWGDITPEGVIARKALHGDTAYMESGNPLLASRGARPRLHRREQH